MSSKFAPTAATSRTVKNPPFPLGVDVKVKAMGWKNARKGRIIMTTDANVGVRYAFWDEKNRGPYEIHPNWPPADVWLLPAEEKWSCFV